jgi:hypothetical protein
MLTCFCELASCTALTLKDSSKASLHLMAAPVVESYSMPEQVATSAHFLLHSSRVMVVDRSLTQVRLLGGLEHPTLQPMHSGTKMLGRASGSRSLSQKLTVCTHMRSVLETWQVRSESWVLRGHVALVSMLTLACEIFKLHEGSSKATNVTYWMPHVSRCRQHTSLA